MSTTIEQLLHIDEVADLLGICPRGVRRLAQRGELAVPVKVGRSTRFLASDVAAYLERIKEERPR